MTSTPADIHEAAALVWRDNTCPDCGGKLKVSEVQPIGNPQAGRISLICENRKAGNCEGWGAFRVYWSKVTGFFGG